MKWESCLKRWEELFQLWEKLLYHWEATLLEREKALHYSDEVLHSLYHSKDAQWLYHEEQLQHRNFSLKCWNETLKDRQAFLFYLRDCLQTAQEESWIWDTKSWLKVNELLDKGEKLRFREDDLWRKHEELRSEAQDLQNISADEYLWSKEELTRESEKLLQKAERNSLKTSWERWRIHTESRRMADKSPSSSLLEYLLASCGSQIFHNGVGISRDDVGNTTFSSDKVQFSAVAPELFVINQPSIVRLFIYEENFREEVNQIILSEKEPMKETKSGSLNIAKNARVKVILTAPEIHFRYASEERTWIGEYLQYAIPVTLPETYHKSRIQFDAKVYVEGVCRVCLSFVADCVSANKQRLNIQRRDIHSAFISYARENIQEVLGRIQTIQKFMPDLDLFFDKDNIRSGEYWEAVLRWEIEKRDILYLFWSKAASESEWVEKEWRYALELKGLDGIDPFPMEKIPPCPSPPKELKSKHFQDKWLYFQ